MQRFSPTNGTFFFTLSNVIWIKVSCASLLLNMNFIWRVYLVQWKLRWNENLFKRIDKFPCAKNAQTNITFAFRKSSIHFYDQMNWSLTNNAKINDYHLYRSGENETKPPQHKPKCVHKGTQIESIESIDFPDLPVGSPFQRILSSIIFASLIRFFSPINT